MAARPRGQQGWVELDGSSWVGYYYEYAEGKRSARRQRLIGDKKKLTKTAAERLLRTWLDEHINSIRLLPLSPTMADIWDLYRRRYARSSVGHARTMKSSWACHLQPAFGAELVEGITEFDIEAFFDSLQIGSSGKDKCRVLLKALLQYAVRENVIRTSPMHRASLRFDSTAATQTLNIGEVRGMRKQLIGLDLLMFEVLISTGLSRSEFLALRPDDIGPEGIRVDEKVFEGREGQTKTMRRRDTVACPPEVLSGLMSYAGGRVNVDGRREKCWLWPAERGTGPMDPDRFTARLQDAGRAAGITKRVDWRILRRTWATLSAKWNAVSATASQLRNNPATAAKHYIQAGMDERQVAVDSVWAEISDKPRVM